MSFLFLNSFEGYHMVPNILADVIPDVPYHNRDGPVSPAERLKKRITEAKINREIIAERENRKRGQRSPRANVSDLLELF